MKILYLFLIALSLNFSAHAEGLYSGEWSGQNVIDGSTTSTLTLDIEQNGNKLRGQYCYVSQGGNRIDCPEKGINNLRGVLNGTTAQINFDSTFGGKNGQAVIKLNGNSMEWNFLKKPEGGGFYTPKIYSLIKKIEP